MRCSPRSRSSPRPARLPRRECSRSLTASSSSRNGNLVVADGGSGRIVRVYSKTGHYGLRQRAGPRLRPRVRPGTDPVCRRVHAHRSIFEGGPWARCYSRLRSPTGLAVAPDRSLYVVEGDRDRVLRIGPRGARRDRRLARPRSADQRRARLRPCLRLGQPPRRRRRPRPCRAKAPACRQGARLACVADSRLRRVAPHRRPCAARSARKQ